jgi:L-iditol 2-dehydrogenase
VSAHAATADSRPLRQAVLIEPGRLEICDYQRPQPARGEMLIRIRCALSCGTDLKAWRRGHPLWKMPTPFGHEFAGIVEEVGEAVTAFKPGDAVMAAPTAPCGICFYCQRGQENLCPDAVGRMVMGGYADMLLLPAHIVARNAFIKPPEVPFEEAALLEPLSCVVHALDMARPARHETAMVIGAGAFGLLHLRVLKASGVREVVVVGRGEDRLRWAAEFGADRVVDARAQDAAAEAAKLNGGFGPDLVIECTGQVQGWSDALARVRRGGRVVFFGGCPPGTALSVDTRRMHYDNLTLLAPFHFRPSDVRRAYELLARRELGAGAVVNASRGLDQLGEVFEMLERGAVLKCAVLP